MAQIYARLGDKNQALAALEQAYHDRDSNLTYVKVEPAFDDFRSDPRFQKIVQQLALPSEACTFGMVRRLRRFGKTRDAAHRGRAAPSVPVVASKERASAERLQPAN